MANFFFISGNQNLTKKILPKMSDKFYKCGNLRPDDQKSNTMLSIKNFFFYIFLLLFFFSYQLDCSLR